MKLAIRHQLSIGIGDGAARAVQHLLMGLWAADREGEVRDAGLHHQDPINDTARNQLCAEAERQAMNTPVQGSAADLIKKAMIDLHGRLRERRLRSRLILQIHDELLLEVPEAEAETARALVKEVMEGALSLDVPLLVDARVGRSWAEVH